MRYALASVTPVLADVELGNVAEWVAAIGTVGALLATYLLLRHELRTRREDERERREAQARLVTVEATPSRGGLPYRGESDPTPRRAMEVHIIVRNDSAEPIIVLGCEAEAYLRMQDHRRVAAGRRWSDTSVVRGGGMEHGFPLMLEQAEPMPADRPLGEVVRFQSSVHFRDRGGIEWRAFSDGRLERLPGRGQAARTAEEA